MADTILAKLGKPKDEVSLESVVEEAFKRDEIVKKFRKVFSWRWYNAIGDGGGVTVEGGNP
jgi:hypothetical protein